MKMKIVVEHKLDHRSFELFTNINFKLNSIMASLKELEEKADLLQQTVDSEQAQIQAALDKLNQSITDLQAIIEEGGTVEQRQAIADKLDATRKDLEATIPDEEPE